MPQREYIQSIKAQYPDARHHCWAFVAGRPDDSQPVRFFRTMVSQQERPESQ
ncbi:IMPACT family member yigZ [Providencia stuartii]|nr:IMPACT family member yigZ [Providencia stuartii]